MPTERKVTLKQFRNVLDDQHFSRRIDEVVVHHTWKPTSADYRGESTVRGVRQFHMRVRGWSDNGYHVMIGPVEGHIYLCRPMSRSGAHVKNRNGHTIGVSYIADFDAQSPATYDGFNTGQEVVAALCRSFNLQADDVRFHREFASKSCPGSRVNLDEYQGEINALLAFDLPEQDVAPWARYAVDWAKREGLLVGKTDGLFHGYYPVTRQELAVAEYRFQKWLRDNATVNNG